MSILIVSSTIKEILQLIDKYDFKQITNHIYQCNEITILISGIGIHNISLHTTKQISKKKYDLVINAGIAGSFSQEFQLGEIANVTSDCFADLGIEDGDEFKSLFDCELVSKNEFPFTNGYILNKSILPFPIQANSASAITVNTVSGNGATIKFRKKKYNPDIESMEGAGFAFVCEHFNQPYIQIRSVSNMIDVRSNQEWNFDLAVEKLNSFLSKLLF
ncbi:MAG TPA: futalosine hydrolase [Bacteroidales bacterium]|nr:MAG: futalosine hydrolase [Bacteroidetes bacterium GWF2_33_38]OFY72326.1 MAG: futalosine hydrolase [Bacteroidetes bacterium RIFOXYA12_FULL_33_9]OFY91589.1 MAG: futalosine hydrolase [Bacteroidetes bacterium RIFOXYA2_FULL_33_7]HBF88576.1 futalosine hydrolase [Bacteroidales bacterium]